MHDAQWSQVILKCHVRSHHRVFAPLDKGMSQCVDLKAYEEDTLMGHLGVVLSSTWERR